MTLATSNTDTFLIAGDPFLRSFLPGDSAAMNALRAKIYNLNVAHKNHRMVRSILLLGERGVGKGYTARVIAAHLRALRSQTNAMMREKFDDVHRLAEQAGFREQALTALPEELAESILFGSKKGAFTGAVHDRVGIFDVAEPIDILLDEIGDATAELQAKLLDVLETRQFRPLGLGFDEPAIATEARVIAATNRDLRALANQGLFRWDLLDRLMWMPIVLPPLRGQRQQFPAILERIHHDLCRDFEFKEILPEATDISWCQTEYSWPGNHRELKQILWVWLLENRSRSLREIVEQRSQMQFSDQQTENLEEVIITALFRHFDGVLQGTVKGFSRVGDLPESLRKLSYKALFLFKEQRRLSNDDLQRLFPSQKVKNIRTLISDNRPDKEETAS